jgi:hypothetical protein
MASVHTRNGWYHLSFRHHGRQYSHALKTKDRREAEATAAVSTGCSSGSATAK